MNKNFEEFIQRMDGNIGYKSVILPLLPKGGVNILDVGGGSGILSHQMKISNPYAHITLLDHDVEMLKIAKENKTADLYVSDMSELAYHAYDAIVLCSVLHEIPRWDSFFEKLLRYIKPGGKFIIRDGFKSENSYTFEALTNSHLRPKKDYFIKLKSPLEAIKFFMDCGEESVIGRLSLEFDHKGVYGTKDQVRSFLQTYTWGFESMYREKNENHLFATKDELYEHIAPYVRINETTFKYTPICQQNYFKHLNKIAEINEMWNTHFVLEVTTHKETK